jgi:hypothetical protein
MALLPRDVVVEGGEPLSHWINPKGEPEIEAAPTAAPTGAPCEQSPMGPRQSLRAASVLSSQ